MLIIIKNIQNSYNFFLNRVHNARFFVAPYWQYPVSGGGGGGVLFDKTFGLVKVTHQSFQVTDFAL